MERDTLKLIYFLALPVVVIALFHITGLSDRFAQDYRPAWEAWSAGHHWWASIILFGVFAATSAVGIPRVYPSVLVGGLFSIPLAVAVAVAGAAVGAMIPFLGARRLGPPVVERKFGHRYRAWVERINASGFSVVLLLRLFPGSNAMLVNMLCGISRIDVRQFFAATLVGIVPSTVAFVLLGSGLTRDHPSYLAISVVTLLVLTLASLLAWRGIRNGRAPSRAQAA
jgi:uncharacterized membrane protein YdjX (TVP38/TMEM64 family)